MDTNMYQHLQYVELSWTKLTPNWVKLNREKKRKKIFCALFLFSCCLFSPFLFNVHFGFESRAIISNSLVERAQDKKKKEWKTEETNTQSSNEQTMNRLQIVKRKKVKIVQGTSDFHLSFYARRRCQNKKCDGFFFFHFLLSYGSMVEWKTAIKKNKIKKTIFFLFSSISYASRVLLSHYLHYAPLDGLLFCSIQIFFFMFSSIELHI